MRRKYFGLALAAAATLAPASGWQSTGWAGDQEIAEQIIQKLKADRDAGTLKDFTLDMKVDNGVVLFRGNVAAAEQKQLVLATAKGVDGIAKVVDEVTVNGQATAAAPATPAAATVVRPQSTSLAADDSFDFREALAKQAAATRKQATPATPAPEQGQILRTAAIEGETGPSDQQLTSAVIGAISQAQSEGTLKGFGVDVHAVDGVVEMSGEARTAAQRDLLVNIAKRTPGVKAVRESIQVTPTVTPAATAVTPAGVPAMNAPYRMNQGAPMQAAPVSNYVGGGAMGAPVMGTPVPMAAYGGAATPRYDQPNLPNYAWPGYAAYPNYAAVTYPQQYSPSAFPYIGPFYPYPQVPLGWRKVSLEWDDGWWYLDFTDR